MTNEVVPYTQMQHMAASLAKSGLFAVKQPEAALSLMLIAQAEGIHPAQAMMDYDVIQGRPALKASAMLARFQRAGGTVEWLEASDKRVSGKFSHPSGGATVVTWDDARVKQAGLDSRDMHKKFPQQMKRARCISEGVRAVCPGVTPLNMYTPEETIDMEPVDVTPVATVQQRIEAIEGAPMPSSEVSEWLDTIKAATSLDSLKAVYGEAYKAARTLKDKPRMDEFHAAYNARKDQIEAEAVTP